MKDVADLIVELGRRAVEAKELFQGLGLRTDARLGSPRGGGRTERLLSKIHRAYHQRGLCGFRLETSIDHHEPGRNVQLA